MKEQISTNVYNLQKGDTVYFLQSNGDIKESIWEDSSEQQNIRNLGYAFLSKEAANDKLMLRKILVALRANEYSLTTENWKNDKEFKYSLAYDFKTNELDINRNTDDKTDNLFFKSSADIIIALESFLYNMKIDIKEVVKNLLNINFSIDDKDITIIKPAGWDVSDIETNTFIKGDKVFLLNTDGTIIESEWIGNDEQKMMKDLGFVFTTKEETQFEIKNQLIEEKIKQYAHDFTQEEWCNEDITKYYLDFSFNEKEIGIYDSTIRKFTRFNFKEIEDTRKVIKEIGIKDLLLYYFKVEESYVMDIIDSITVVDHSNEDE